MDAAKSKVKDFMSKSGKHDTTVHENMAPAVTNETVNRQQHEEVTQAVDREVHQDHYHTTVQPVKDTRQLDTQHHHNVAGVEHRKFEHGNDDEVQRRLHAERAKFRDTTTHGETRHTTSEAPTMVGEHIHHHVHENIQPVVQRQTIEPHVVHTTVPIHETHHSAAQHHSTSALPAVSMQDFKTKGGSLTGRDAKTDFFEGEPKSMMGHAPASSNPNHEFRKTGHVDQHPHTTSAATGAATGAAAGGIGSKLTGSRRSSSSSSSSSDDERGHRSSRKTAGVGAGLTGSHHAGTTGTGSGLTGTRDHTGTSTGLTGSHHTGTTGVGSGLPGSHNTHAGTDGPIGGRSGASGLTGATGTSTGLPGTNDTAASHKKIDSVNDNTGTTHQKPSLMDKLNPYVDANGDGKPGFMK